MLLERVSALWLRAKALVHRRRLDRDLDEELAFHLAMRAEKYAGDPGAARRQFGNAARIRETCRDLWTFAALETPVGGGEKGYHFGGEVAPYPVSRSA